VGKLRWCGFPSVPLTSILSHSGERRSLGGYFLGPVEKVNAKKIDVTLIISSHYFFGKWDVSPILSWGVGKRCTLL
jgi:hypothetical protein